MSVDRAWSTEFDEVNYDYEGNDGLDDYMNYVIWPEIVAKD